MALELNSIKKIVPDDGAWMDVPDWPGVRLMVRSIETKDYQQQRELLVQRRMKDLRRAPTTPEMEPALSKLVARHLLRGWEGLSEGGKPLDYSPETALEKLSDPAYSDLKDQVVLAATLVGQRDAEFNADAEKKSHAPSATN